MYYPLQKELDELYIIIKEGDNKRESTVKCKICNKNYNYLSFKWHYRRKHEIHYLIHLHKKSLFYLVN